TWRDCAPEVDILYTPALEELFGPARQQNGPLEQKHKDLACSAQAMYEEAFSALLSALHKKYQCANLAFAGGCALNSVANGKICLRLPFKKIYLPAAAGDAGGAVGAAYVIYHQLADVSSPSSVSHAYLGPQFGDEQIEALLKTRGLHSTENARETLNKTKHR